LWEEQGIEISMEAVGEAWQNGYAERLMRTIKEEEVELSEYRDFEEVYQEIGKFLDDVYTKKRINSSLNYLTPMEFENQWKEQQKEEKRDKKRSVWYMIVRIRRFD
jgi:putative transposase